MSKYSEAAEFIRNAYKSGSISLETANVLNDSAYEKLVLEKCDKKSSKKDDEECDDEECKKSKKCKECDDDEECEKCKKEDENVKESELLSVAELIDIFTEAEMAVNGTLFEERVSMADVEEKYTSAMKTAKEYSTQAKNFVKDKKYDEAIKAYENEKKAVQEAIDAINSDTSGFTGALKGNIVYSLINLVPSLIFAMNRSATIATNSNGEIENVVVHKKNAALGAAETIYKLNEFVKDLRGIVEIFKKRGMTWDVFNSRKTTIIGKMKNYINFIDTEIKYLQKKKEVVKESVYDIAFECINDAYCRNAISRETAEILNESAHEKYSDIM